MDRQEESVATHQGREVSPVWHREELHKRRAKVLRGTSHFQRWDDAMATLRAELRDQRVR